jgi:hypothetical protein
VLLVSLNTTSLGNMILVSSAHMVIRQRRHEHRISSKSLWNEVTIGVIVLGIAIALSFCEYKHSIGQIQNIMLYQFVYTFASISHCRTKPNLAKRTPNTDHNEAASSKACSHNYS